MATDIERRRPVGEHYRVVERVTVCHERCSRENPVPMRVDDAFIHIASEAKIVRIDNEPSGLRHVTLENGQLDAQELLRVGMHILDQRIHFPRRAV